MMTDYQAFIRSKIAVAQVRPSGFSADRAALHPSFYEHQKDTILWALRGGRRALFLSFGLGKTGIQLELARLVHEREGGLCLIICPLGVKQEFQQVDARRLGMDVRYVQTDADVLAADTPYLITNYERVRDGDITPSLFNFVTLDEASVLRSYGSKTYQTFIDIFQDVPYRYVCTATPAPNRHKEIIHYAAFLGVMDSGQALTRFFQRDSKKANNLTLYPHKEQEFWLWVASWGLFLDRPSDLGYSDDGYDLPELRVHWERIGVDHTRAWKETDGRGQHYLIADAAMGLKEAAREKRETMIDRVSHMQQIVEAHGHDAHWLIWHHLEDERSELCKALSDVKTVYGSQPIEKREKLIIDFSEGKFPILATKPQIAGSGCNFQRHCSKNIFLGVDYKFNDFIQAIHRTYRFQQKDPVDIYIIYAESEDAVVETLRRRWKQHDATTERMRQIVKKYGLTNKGMNMDLQRTIEIERQEVRGELFTAVNNDCVHEVQRMADNSVDLIHTSIPFGNQYEYTPSYLDFGHNSDNNRFFEQMDFLIPDLLRILKPGRIAAIHVKDRIRFGNVTGLGMPTVDRFSDKTADAFEKHGFVFCGRISIDTDVVRENNQTYRLGWSENAKDSTKMGVGMQEYVLLFRKLPSDLSNSYADEPVTKDKEVYTRAWWQIDAAGFWKSSGNRLLDPETTIHMPLDVIGRWYRQHSQEGIYDYHQHIELGEGLEKAGKLPASFMLFAPQSNDDGIWTDVVRMRTLNTNQSQKQTENHICPLQLDIVERIIGRYTNPNDLVFDPFAGVMTVPYMAIKAGRRGYGVELNPEYFHYGVAYCQDAEVQARTPTLFDLMNFDTAQEMPEQMGMTS